MQVSKRSFTNSLSYSLAKNSVLVTLIVGFSLSFAQIGVDYLREQDAIDQFAAEILAANQFAAADATYHLDKPAALEVAKGILQYHYITSVKITNESGENLAQMNTTITEENAPSQQMSNIFGETKNYSRALYHQGEENIGSLTIYIDPVLAAEGFVDRSVLVLISGFVRNILLAFILVFLFYYTTTKKVLTISHSLQGLDPSDPDKNYIPPLSNNNKKKNELDDLSENINKMLHIMSDDIQEREQREKQLKASQKELMYQANHDGLTGLVNRRGFEYLLAQAMRVKESDSIFCYLDLDQFKIINDTCGHVAGDELLRQISHVLSSNIRAEDQLARLGGDEFGILMQSHGDTDITKVIQKLIDHIAQYRFLWNDKSYAVTASIGIAKIDDNIQSTTDLLRKADIACYTAKDAGRNCYRLYEDGILDVNRVHGEMEWVNKINHALENDRFCLYAQIIKPNSGASSDTLHYEVLLRMLDANNKVVAPNAFLPAAERYHLMNRIDKWVIENQFKYLSEHPEHLEKVALCSINLSGPSLTSPGFKEFVIKSLHKFTIPAHKICFEITETAAISNLTDAIYFIDELHSKGCKFALDDFGTGVSSFAYLKNLPVDYLKIDGVFVKGIIDDPIDFAMVKSIHEVANVMGKKTVAEFVENDDIEQRLRDIGVDYSQGYGIAKPCPVNDLGFSKLSD